MTSTAPKRAVAYLQAQYPMLSMIFVIREVLQLKRLGFRIDVASINGSDRPPEGLTDDERQESQLTYYVKAHGLGGALNAHVISVLRKPGGWLRGLGLVLRLGGTDIARLLMHLMYFTEALMVGVWMRRKGHSHLHAHLGSQPATVGLYVKRVSRRVLRRWRSILDRKDNRCRFHLLHQRIRAQPAHEAVAI
jgi:colanic acid/amylovoran biosynthesis glycosyltransferase